MNAKKLNQARWHESQVFTERKDGTTVTELKVQLTPDLKNRLIGLGKTIEDLQPKSLRQEIAAEIKEMAKRY